MLITERIIRHSIRTRALRVASLKVFISLVKIKGTSLPMPASAICGVNNATEARYGALSVSNTFPIQVSRVPFTIASNFCDPFPPSFPLGYAIIFMRESSRDRSTPSSVSPTFERINHLTRLTATTTNLGRGAHRGCEDDGDGGKVVVEVRARSFLVWSINGAH